MEDKINNEIPEEQFQKLTPEQKKTIWEWMKYLGKSLLTAILKKLTGVV
jgi:hypothetical protein